MLRVSEILSLMSQFKSEPSLVLANALPCVDSIGIPPLQEYCVLSIPTKHFQPLYTREVYPKGQVVPNKNLKMSKIVLYLDPIQNALKLIRNLDVYC